ncbi:MAG TPA: NADH-quinone oxidoreductase subunit N [Candidatus Sulfotelmatobacter sp.]|jgi:NADH-quinone oxidoreductase subunit N|nr:NADH-quinone oxidoreductase subunit N [Candidatus Sulfotelmatobacter sp.]
MNSSLISLEVSVIAIGLVLMLADFFVPAERRRFICYFGIVALGALLLINLSGNGNCDIQGTAFNGAYINDGLAIFFKRFFMIAAILVLFIAAEFADKLAAGAVAEYYSLIVFALAGMLFAASSNDFAMLFVSIELITITFYVLVSFQRSKIASLEAGVKYLILGALSSAFLIFGIALIWGTTGELNFTKLAAVAPQFETSKIFLLGVLLVLVGLGFKIAAFPFQIWAPDVYQGAPTPTTAFLAVGSKAAGFVLLLRVLFTALPTVTMHWEKLLIVISAITILWGNLCALPQRNLKRMLGYSSIAHAGYLLLGVAALNASGQAAILYYLAGYLFTTLAAFLVIAVVLRHLDNTDVSGLAGLSRRSPLLAATMTISMVSLAGIPPLAGFFGKFLLLKSVVEAAKATHGHETAYYWLVAIALTGVVISIYYYFNVVRAIFWSKDTEDLSPIQLSAPAKLTACVCIAGIFWLGLFPNTVLNLAQQAVAVAVQ